MISDTLTTDQNLAAIASTLDMICKFMTPHSPDGKPIYMVHSLQEKLYDNIVEIRDDLVSLIGGAHA